MVRSIFEAVGCNRVYDISRVQEYSTGIILAEVRVTRVQTVPKSKVFRISSIPPSWPYAVAVFTAPTELGLNVSATSTSAVKGFGMA